MRIWSPEPRRQRPQLDRMTPRTVLLEPIELPHAHQGCLSGTDLAEKEHLHSAGIPSSRTTLDMQASKRSSNFLLECSPWAFAQAASRICWYSPACSSIQHIALATAFGRDESSKS